MFREHDGDIIFLISSNLDPEIQDGGGGGFRDMFRDMFGAVRVQRYV